MFHTEGEVAKIMPLEENPKMKDRILSFNHIIKNHDINLELFQGK